MNKQKIILFDIDYTLFNTDLFRDKTYPRLMDLLKQEDTPEYHVKVKEVEKELVVKGGYEPVGFARTLSDALAILPKRHELEKLFYNPDLYDECLYPEVKNLLKILSERKNIVLGIVSRGEGTFQRRKIQVIQSFFSKENIFISLTKVDMIRKILEKFKEDKLFVIDDSAPFLYEIKKQNSNVLAILVEKENRYERKPVAENFVPDAVITNLEEVVTLVDKEL